MGETKFTGRIKKIRVWLDENPEGDLRDLYDEFGGQEMRATMKALEYLENRQELVMAAPLYRYGRKHANEQRETKQTGMFRAMRARAQECRIVELGDIVKNVQVDISYARRYLNFLQDLNYIKIRSNPKGQTTIAVLEKAMREINIPHYNQRREKKTTEPKRPAKKGTDL
jgi:hypothetical protein